MNLSGFCLSGPRVGFIIYFLQPGGGDMGINLGGGDAFMSEQFLDAAKVGAVVQQMSRKGMPECMGRYFFIG